MNKELDSLLCLLDGKITAYRMKNPYSDKYIILDNAYLKLVQMQLEIQTMWKLNRGN